jgi:zinc transport system ATP-binding protein
MKPSSQVILELADTSLGYGDGWVMTDIDIQLRQGEWISLIGPNGSGKSTLLKGLLGCIPQMSGRRQCLSQNIGYVPQRFSLQLNSPITVKEFLELGSASSSSFNSSLNSDQEQLVGDLGVQELLNTSLTKLSGGELQKVLLSFALWNKPDILMLDEYLHGLDLNTQNHIVGYIEMLKFEKGLTVLEVSHDVSAVVHSADRVVLVRNAICYDGSPEEQGFHECLHDIYGYHFLLQHDGESGNGHSH